MSSQRDRRLLLWLGGAVVVLQGVILLAVFQPSPHSGGDNAAYIALAHALVEGKGYVELWEPGAPAHAKYPPVFSAVLAGAILLGAVTWSHLKVISVLFVSLSVLLTFAWVHGRRGPAFAATVALLIVLSDAFLSASHWVLSEPPFVAFVLLALWAADRVGPGWWKDGEDPPPADPQRATAWIAVAGAAALLAYFTRGAALPLLLTFLLWLGLRRAWKPLAAALLLFLLPAGLWWARVRRVGEDDYASEFWMVDPYRPEAGEAGIADLIARMGANLQGYVGVYFPEGLVGARGWLPALLGIALALAALLGWIRRVRRGPGLAELFLPFYSGLILLWPEVWSGDRFALPLYPLLLFYGGETVVDSARAVGRRVSGRGGRMLPYAAGAGAALLFAVPALGGWMERVETTSLCRAQVERAGVWSCHPPPVHEFAAAARWSGAHLPDGAVVVSRKPRIFYLLSGTPSRMFPMSANPDLLFAELEASGASYVLLDWVDGVGFRYLQPAVGARVEAFCHLAAWGGREEAQTNLLGVLDAEERPRPGAARREGDSVLLDSCPDHFVRADPGRTLEDDGRIPLLSGYLLGRDP